MSELTLPQSPGAYRWWYVDGVSADGRDALVAIFFWGSVFSPYYAARYLRGEVPHPRDHVGVHVALYRGGKRLRWLFVERRGEVQVDASGLSIGRSRLSVSDDLLEADFDESHLGALRGSLRLEAEEPELSAPLLLSPNAGDHRWHPRMPRGRLTARFAAPDFQLSGTGYHDGNWGSEPLGLQLAGWDWSREHAASATRIHYDLLARDGRRFQHVLRSGHAPVLGEAAERRVSPGRSSWGLRLPATGTLLESAPFYARYRLPGERGLGETLDLTRLDSAFLRTLLRFRTRRAAPLRAPRALEPA